MGAKGTLLDNRLTYDLAGYYTRVTDMQFFEFLTGTFGILRVDSNIDKVRLQGAELGFVYRPVRGVTLTAGGNVLDSKILPQIPVARLGKPEEVAGLIIYLCSEEAAFVTGANIAINGGQHMQ